METRFGKFRPANLHVDAYKLSDGTTLYPAKDYSHLITDYHVTTDYNYYDRSPCYIHPESYQWGNACPDHPWSVTFDASKSTAEGFAWTVNGGKCDSYSSQKIKCSFPSLKEYTVKLKLLGDRHETDEQKIVLKDLLIVSLGDSLASGEGVPDLPTEVVDHFKIDIGIGKPLFIPIVRPAIWEDRQCHRSARAGPALAAKAIEDADPHTSVTFVHLACSGAGIRLGLVDFYPGQEAERFTCSTKNVTGLNACAGRQTPHFCVFSDCNRIQRPQIDTLAQLVCPTPIGIDSHGRIERTCPNGARRIDVLMLSAGANDVGFGEVVKACMLFLNCQNRKTTHGIMWSPEENAFVRVLRNIDENIAKLASDYRDLSKAIKAKLSVEPNAIFVTEYPDTTHDEKGNYCNHMGGDARKAARSQLGKKYLGLMFQDPYDPVVEVDGIKADEYRWAHNEIVKPLNNAVKAAASELGWTFVGGIQAEFRQHGLCAERKESWVNGLDASLENQGDYDGTMHPNIPGHETYKTALTSTITQALRR